MVVRISISMSSETASSNSPDSELAITFQPDQRMFSATSAASAGSRIAQPVTTASATPATTPTEEITSDKR